MTVNCDMCKSDRLPSDMATGTGDLKVCKYCLEYAYDSTGCKIQRLDAATDKRLATSLYMERREAWYAVTLTILRCVIDKAKRRGQAAVAAQALLEEIEECREGEIPGETAEQTGAAVREYLASGGVA